MICRETITGDRGLTPAAAFVCTPRGLRPQAESRLHKEKYGRDQDFIGGDDRT